jgi:hypothetical protein
MVNVVRARSIAHSLRVAHDRAQPKDTRKVALPLMQLGQQARGDVVQRRQVDQQQLGLPLPRGEADAILISPQW